MSEHIRIGFDLDGVIIDHTQNKIRAAARLGYTLLPEDTPSEMIGKILPPHVNLILKEQIYDDTDEALSAPLMKGAYDGLARLHEHGMSYTLISRRKHPLHAIHLLERRGLWDRYFLPENTYFVERMEDKDVIAKKLGLTHFVDDELQVLGLMPSVSMRILFDAHQVASTQPEYAKVSDWVELSRLFGLSHS